MEVQKVKEERENLSKEIERMLKDFEERSGVYITHGFIRRGASYTGSSPFTTNPQDDIYVEISLAIG